MEGAKKLQMSSSVEDYKNSEIFLKNDGSFDEKSSLVANESEMSVLAGSSRSSSTLDMDRSLYMENTVTWYSALVHVIKGSLAVGALGLPFAVMHAGIVVGPLLIILSGVIMAHCMHLMVRSSHFFCDRSENISLGYAEVAEMAVGLYYENKKHIGSLVVKIVLVMTQIGFCCVYILFVAETFQQILNKYVYLDIKLWVAIILVPIVLLSFIHTLKVMAVLSAISNVLYITGIIYLLVYAGSTAHNPATLPTFVGFGTLPLAFSNIVFSVESIALVLPVENMMALPQNFYCVLRGGMVIVIVISVLVGTLGYLSCGNQCLGSFTLNFPNTVFGVTVKLMLAIAVLFTYFIQFYVLMEIIIPPLQEKIAAKYHTLVDYGTRTLMVCCTGILSLGIPQLGNMISLSGSLGCISLAITFPPAIHIATLYHDKTLTTFSLVKDIILICFGILGTVAGLYASLVTIIWTFEHPSKHISHHGQTANSTL